MEKTRLPGLSIELPEWPATAFDGWRRRSQRLGTLTKNAGTGSTRFRRAVAELNRAGLRHGSDAVAGMVRDRVDARALAYLWAHEAEFARRVPVTRSMLQRLEQACAGRISRLLLVQLLHAFFVQFDRLARGEDLAAWGALLRRELAQLNRGADTELRRVAAARDHLLHLEGPSWLARQAAEKRRILEEVAGDHGLAPYASGEFLQRSRLIYYLDTLRQMPVGAADPVLAQVSQRAVYEASVSDTRLVGHEVLGILIDRAEPGHISDAWRNVILTIAGDPRVPTGSQRYTKWWSIVGPTRVAKVRGWLSRFDLLLFLQVLEDYGRSSGDLELQRMFPSRKRFLEGLHEQGIIQETRLFVNPRAEHYLRQNYKREELPEFAKVKDSYRSMIYLRVGNLHMVEGSHSFKLWIYPELPKRSRLLDYAKRTFDPRELGMGLHEQYMAEYGSSADRPASITHTPQNFAWQHKAIQYLQEKGVSLQVWKLFDAPDYKLYKRIHGA